MVVESKVVENQHYPNLMIQELMMMLKDLLDLNLLRYFHNYLIDPKISLKILLCRTLNPVQLYFY
jgi:hypothetical protein